MIEPPDDRRAPVSPQLALRVAVMGVIALGLFGIVFFRLWFLQILSGDQYLAQANENRVRNITVPAPRGQIVDRNGAVLADNRSADSVIVEPPRLPPAGPRRRALYRRLSPIIGVPAPRISELVHQQLEQLPYGNATIKADVPRPVFNYLLERQREFPGVTVQQTYLRRYPYGEVAAHVLGTVGQISAQELKWSHFKGVAPGSVVGQMGLEYSYDRYLRGRDGAARVQVNSLGEPKGYLPERQPVQGKQLKLSLDINLEKTGLQAIQSAAGGPGAFVALDPRNGQVLGMGSSPSFDPNIFAKPEPAGVYKQVFGGAESPVVNRAIDGQYPTGSTFKLITATAGLESGLITPGTVVYDGGRVTIGGRTFQNAGGAGNGAVALVQAIKVSSDVYFYLIGAHANTDKPQGGPIQKWARLYGFGRPSGIDLPGEAKGFVPTPGWRDRGYAHYLRCHKQGHRNCGLIDRPWSIGDNVNFATGQGDFLSTPLQLADAYATLINGGRVIRPHVGMEIQNDVGDVLQSVNSGVVRRLGIDPSYRQAILEGLHEAASQPGGTSADVFRGFPRPVYGKTGTAQHQGSQDQSWYVCYVPDPARPIVVAVTVERGGFGAQAAAPAARLILSQWFGIRKQLVHGSSHTY